MGLLPLRPLQSVGVHYGRKKAREPSVHLVTSGAVEDFHPAAFAADETGFPQDADVLGQGGLWDGLGQDSLNGRTAGRALLREDLGADGKTYGIDQGVQDRLYGYVFDRGMEQGPHGKVAGG